MQKFISLAAQLVMDIPNLMVDECEPPRLFEVCGRDGFIAHVVIQGAKLLVHGGREGIDGYEPMYTEEYSLEGMNLVMAKYECVNFVQDNDDEIVRVFEFFP
jgi:hypothetical protein